MQLHALMTTLALLGILLALPMAAFGAIWLFMSWRERSWPNQHIRNVRSITIDGRTTMFDEPKSIYGAIAETHR
jgi:hypothetical protein